MVIFAALVLSLQNFGSRGYAQGKSGELPGPSARPTPTPAPKGGTKSARPAPIVAPPAPTIPAITYNQTIKSRLDPKASERAPNGNLFEEHLLNAKSSDLLAFQLQTDNPSLAVQVFDKDNAEIPLAKDASTGNFTITTRNNGLPGDGEYKVRVIGTVSHKISTSYALTVNRIGLLPEFYTERLQKIILNFRESDPASADETLSKLEELIKDDGAKPGAFEFLGIIYLYHRHDLEKAAKAMEQAIKANGAAVIKISFDSQWRRMVKSKSGDFNWQDPRNGWLRIRPGQLLLTDASHKSLATLNGAQIKNLTKQVSSTNNLVVIAADGVRNPFVFLPGTKEQAEADLVIKLIQSYVVKKNN